MLKEIKVCRECNDDGSLKKHFVFDEYGFIQNVSALLSYRKYYNQESSYLTTYKKGRQNGIKITMIFKLC